jgi:hypothetical protein
MKIKLPKNSICITEIFYPTFSSKFVSNGIQEIHTGTSAPLVKEEVGIGRQKFKNPNPIGAFGPEVQVDCPTEYRTETVLHSD